MYHHLRRAKHVYDDRGAKDLLKTAIKYVPIEINNFVFRARYGRGTHVMKDDWDTLVLLDACRYDMFQEWNHLAGNLESRISLGSTSEEFLERNFGSREFHDTVYVNTNPYLPYLDLDQGTFHHVVDLLEEWDPELQTVHPKTVVKASEDAAKRFPNKRLIVHFMQPHYPFIGPRGRELGTRGWNISVEDSSLEGKSIWQRMRERDDIDETVVWEAYCENLEVVLTYVEDLLDTLHGRTVITSDHGNLIGERLGPIPTWRMYGHPLGVYVPELVQVPWLIIDQGTRRHIKVDPPLEHKQRDQEIVEERLRSLGYHE